MLPTNEDRISMKAMCRDPRLSRDGRDLCLNGGYRLKDKGILGPGNKRFRIEFERGPRGYVTTREAIGRFLAALNGHGPEDGPAASPVIKTDPKTPHDNTSKALAAAACDAAGL